MKRPNSIMPENYEEFNFIDPEDQEFKETMKLETPLAPAMPSKTGKSNQNCGHGGKSNEIK